MLCCSQLLICLLFCVFAVMFLSLLVCVYSLLAWVCVCIMRMGICLPFLFADFFWFCVSHYLLVCFWFAFAFGLALNP